MVYLILHLFTALSKQCCCNLVHCFSRLCVTKLDILDTLAEIKVGISYKSKGEKLNYFPSNTAELAGVEVCPNYSV